MSHVVGRVAWFAAIALAASTVRAGAGAGSVEGDVEGDAFPSSSPRTIDVDGVQVRFSFLVPHVERPTRVPVQIVARRSADSRSELATVSFCADWRCALVEPVVVPVDGPPVVVEATLGPAGVIAKVRTSPSSWGEGTCCAGEVGGRVIATTRRTERVVQVTNGDPTRSSAGWLIDVGDVLARRPELVHGFGALIVADGHEVDAGVLAGFLARGGIVSLPEDLAARLAAPLGLSLAAASPVVLPRDEGGQRELRVAGVLVSAAVPTATRATAHGAGFIVVRPAGASADEELAGVLAAQATFLDRVPSGEVEQVIEAAGVAVARRPSRLVAFAIPLAALVGVVVLVRRRRRRPWARTILASFGVGVVASVALWLLEVVAVPAETRSRVVVWSGPGGGWETGAEAVRPRGVARVQVRTPAPLHTVTTVGRFRSSSQPVEILDGRTTASATIDSSGAIVGVWSRPAARIGAVEIVGDVLVNNLDVPLLGAALDNGSRIHGPIPAGGRAPVDAFALRAYDEAGPVDSDVAASRLLVDITNRCVRYVPPENQMLSCAAVVARLEDGTLLGIQVPR